LKNFVSVPGAWKKIIPKYKGPYKVHEALENDRYAISDVEGFQLSQVPYKGIWEAANMKLCIECETINLDDEIEKQDLDDEIEQQYLDDEIEKQDSDDDIEKQGKEV